MQSVTILALLALSAQAVNMDMSDKAWRERPVQKVVGMLKEMKAQLDSEAEADQEMYDKMTCYCDSNEKEKTKSVADAEQRVTELTALIEETAAKSSTLSTEIATLKDEVADNTDSLTKATDIRAKENAEFVADEANMNEGIEGLRGAVSALSKQHGAALTQESLIALKSKLSRNKAALQKLDQATRSTKFVSFLQKQAPTNSGSYAPQSGEIFGMLKQMKEGFETNLADAKKEEASSLATFNEMKASKTKELQSAEASIQSKESEKADADASNSAGKTDLADTRASLAADNEFLANLKVQCDNFASEYAERTKTRTEETAAVSEVIGMLTDDDAHDLFSRTYSFVQVRRGTSRSAVVKKAAKMLLDSSKKGKNPNLVALAVSMKAGLDSFGTVKAKVQKMIDDLGAEKAEEDKVMAKCKAELKENSDSTEEANEQKADLTTSIEELTNTISNLKDAIATLNQEIAETRVAMKRASEDREAENKEFQMTVADQRATQAILTKALGRLQEFYGGKALIQKQAPAAMGEYKKSAASGGVMMILDGVIQEAADLEKESLKAEQEAQTSYEVFITDSNNSVAAKQADIVSKTELKGQKEEELVAANGDLKGTEDDLSALANIANALHMDCDFLLNNEEIRQEARDQEIESLKMALSMLSGAVY